MKYLQSLKWCRYNINVLLNKKSARKKVLKTISQNVNKANWAVLMFPLAGLGFGYFSICFPVSKMLFLLSSLRYSLSLLDMLFSFPNHYDFSRDFRKEQRLINILLNPPFLPSIMLLFIGENRYSEELINDKIYEFLLKIVHTCMYLRHTNNTVIPNTRVHLYPNNVKGWIQKW